MDEVVEQRKTGLASPGARTDDSDLAESVGGDGHGVGGAADPGEGVAVVDELRPDRCADGDAVAPDPAD